MAVRAGRPSSGSGGIEAYAGLARASLGAAGLLAARISRLLVGEETPLDFANKGKLKGKSKRVTKQGHACLRAAPLSQQEVHWQPHRGSHVLCTGGGVTRGDIKSHGIGELSGVGGGSARRGQRDQEAHPGYLPTYLATYRSAKARNDSVEWTV